MTRKPTTQVDLKEQESESGNLNEEKERALIQSIKSDTFSRVVLVLAMISLFIILNFFVIEIITEAVASDAKMINDKLIKPSERLITENVYMTLIGGTVAQLGTVIIAMAHYFFPKK